ncbi:MULTISPECIES: hypothetical protein [Asticcacaulis]|uniref:hypothetical protein n=1 Tax=Asticcacaulis TaxID=76890 RepID=UPI001AE46876|nr:MULTISPECIES: hypothetical protein [Asticcacaulis]MBP2161227.1 dienelactone hydrolase [Asticcacaulis solisilvae]MDR6802272.1 dienelactone hydrolase [Asticcacaulis sp. BE141]
MKPTFTIMAGLAFAAFGSHAAAESGSGPYPAVFEQDPTLPAHVVYRPEKLAELKSEKLGIYVFGNGACSADGTSSKNHLLEIASQGYLAVAPGTIPVPQPQGGTPDGPPPGGLRASTTAESLTEAIDWAVGENAREGSPYYQRLDPEKIAVSGFSCGGLQALSIAKDPRIATVIVMNSGIFNAGNPIAGIKVDKSMLADLHGSVLYVLGGPTDIAHANGMDDYSRINHIPAAHIDIPVGHGGTYMEPHGGIGAEVVTAWLNWRLKGDAAAAKKFQGEGCAYCVDKRITYEYKNF